MNDVQKSFDVKIELLRLPAPSSLLLELHLKLLLPRVPKIKTFFIKLGHPVINIFQNFLDIEGCFCLFVVQFISRPKLVT